MYVKIESLLRTALKKLFAAESQNSLDEIVINIERPRNPEHGDFSCNIAMTLAKKMGMPPRALAEKIIASIPADIDIEKIEIAGAGFINFKLSNYYIQQLFKTILHSPNCGVTTVSENKTVVIDYSSPNLAKEMHVGHLRSTIIGDAIARVLELKGYNVIRQNHVGDWGTQFGMLLAHLADEENLHQGTIQLNDLESFYKAAKNRFDTDQLFADRARKQVVLLQSGDENCLNLWKRFIKLSLAHCEEIYQRLGVSLRSNDIKAESSYNHLLPMIVNSLQTQGLLVQNDGAQCVFLEEFKGKDNDYLPIIVQKKDGGYLYSTTDLAAIYYRQKELNAERILYVVDARQTLHFQQIFALAHKAGFANSATQLEHISFGMVLDKSGKPFKSREGGVTKLVDLLDEAEKRAKKLIANKQIASYSKVELDAMTKILGVAAIKYADLSKNRTSDYIFDWDTMISFEGNTAPYLLYAYTRINSLLQKSTINIQSNDDDVLLPSMHDNLLMKHILMFPNTIEIVALKAIPHALCVYLYELAGIFSSFYEVCPILNNTDPSLQLSRLKLVSVTAKILKLGLQLLGIQTLDRM